MAQNWRLGDFDETGPFLPERADIESEVKSQTETRWVLIDSARRMLGYGGDDGATSGVSRVEAAMQRNAPDLAGVSATEMALIEAERAALMARRWPRPRLLSLILVGTVAAVMPTAAVRVLIWSLVLFLVAAVAVGPERVRDGLRDFYGWCLEYWQHELRLAQRLLSGGD